MPFSYERAKTELLQERADLQEQTFEGISGQGRA